MVKIPTEEELGFVTPRADRPPALVTKGEAAQIEEPGKALQGLGSAVSQFGDVLQHQKEQDDHYQATKDIIELQRTQERALDEAHREMQPGGEGFADNWRKSYDEAATEVGRQAKERGYSPKVLADLDTRLVKAGELLHTRAWHQQLAERDRFHVEDLRGGLNKITDSDVARDPFSVQVQIAKGLTLINSSRLSEIEKGKLRRNFPALAEEAAWRSRMANMPNPDTSGNAMDSLQALQRDLKLRPPGLDAAAGGPDFSAGKEGPAAVRYNNPGAMGGGPSATKFGATRVDTINGDDKIAVFPDAVSGAAAQFDLLNRQYAGKSLGDVIRKWSGGNNTNAYLANIQRETGLDPTEPLTPEQLKDPTIAIPLAKAMAKHEAGADYPLSDEQWGAAFDKANGSRATKTAASEGEPGGETGGATIPGDPTEKDITAHPDAPYRHMTAKQRLTAIRIVGEAQRAIDRSDLEKYEQKLKTGTAGEPDGSIAPKLQNLTPKQRQDWTSRLRAADQEGKTLYGNPYAEDERGKQPISDLPESAQIDRIAKIAPKGEDADKIMARTREKATRVVTAIAKERESDPARAVSGGDLKLPGSTPSLQAGENGEISFTHNEEAFGFPPAPEVRQAMATIQAASRQPNGPESIPGTTVVSPPQLSMPGAWKIMAEARLAAQTRQGIPPSRQRIVTVQEAQQILGFNKTTDLSDDDEFRRLMGEAQTKARTMYGNLADRALKDASLLVIKDRNNKETAIQMAAGLLSGHIDPDQLMQERGARAFDDRWWKSGKPRMPEPPSADTQGRRNLMGDLAGRDQPTEAFDPWMGGIARSPMVTPEGAVRAEGLTPPPASATTLGETVQPGSQVSFPQYPKPTDRQIELLKKKGQDSTARTAFDSMFGPGAARKAIGTTANPQD